VSDFHTTHWSLVQRAAGQGDEARQALDALLEAYVYPLYAFARRTGDGVEDAQDHVQGFFERLLEKAWVAQADPALGRFRSFLLAAFKHYRSNEKERARAQKRGGGRPTISLDLEEGEARYRLEPQTDLTPERLYDRRWALTILDRALRRLDERHRGGPPKRARRYEHLRACLEPDHPHYRDLAPELDMTETAVKVAVHRLRADFRDAIRAEIDDTLSTPNAARRDEELHHLLEALRA
jgi:RNA polymerase sigma-70 factor (ECF subfamily)